MVIGCVPGGQVTFLSGSASPLGHCPVSCRTSKVLSWVSLADSGLVAGLEFGLSPGMALCVLRARFGLVSAYGFLPHIWVLEQVHPPQH